MAGEGVTGLSELGAREMSYRLMYIACSVKVRARACACARVFAAPAWGRLLLCACLAHVAVAACHTQVAAVRLCHPCTPTAARSRLATARA
jgi:hypothetical protein